MTGFTEEMDKLAASLAKDANAAEKQFGDRLDAFKALMPYYALLLKNKGKSDDEDPDLPTFDNFQASIHASENLTHATGMLRETSDGTAEPGVRDRRRN